MLNFGIKQHQFVAFWVEREVLEFSRTAIQTHKFAFLTKYTCKLVHNTTVYTDIFMLCSLSGESQIPFGNFIVTKKVIKRKCETTLQSSRRRHSCTKWYISVESSIETLNIHTEGLHFLHNSINVSCPRSARTYGVVNLKFYAILKVNRVAHDCISTIRAYLCHNTFIYSSWEDETSVIVSMLTNKIDTTWRHINVTSFAIKMLDEAASYFFNIHSL